MTHELERLLDGSRMTRTSSAPRALDLDACTVRSLRLDAAEGIVSGNWGASIERLSDALDAAPGCQA